ncbi:MAG: HD domain-containing protein [Candidatus Absconditicoccaceae bacterium]
MLEKNIIKSFLEKIGLESPNFKKDFLTIQKACNIALQAHQGQKRKYSGGPFLEHPIKVALLSARRFADSKLVIASILHDTAEDNKDISLQQIYKTFGYEIGFMVDAVTDNINYFFHDPKKKFNDKIEKILYGGIQDVRCILLKLHDRENNINTLGGLDTDKQIRMSFETQAIYEPLRKLLGFNRNKKKSIKECDSILKYYLLANKINTAQEFKEMLLGQTFYDLDNDTFNLVYKNTNRIFWKIQNKKVFEKLVETKNFDEKIQVISIEQNIDGDFCAIIKYKEGNVFGNFNSKLKIHTSFS